MPVKFVWKWQIFEVIEYYCRLFDKAKYVQPWFAVVVKSPFFD
jgi:hypothetical protein